MASTSKCRYCGAVVSSEERYCQNCGAPNEGFVADSEQRIYTPGTIEELKEYCAERNMPLLRMRFFIGEDQREPKAYGIYRDGNDFIVYKNKADGQRAIRYQGPDEAHAVRELFLKLMAECRLRGISPDGSIQEKTLLRVSEKTPVRVPEKTSGRMEPSGKVSPKALAFIAFVVISILIYTISAFSQKFEGPDEYYYSGSGSSWDDEDDFPDYYYDDADDDEEDVDDDVDYYYIGGDDEDSDWGSSSEDTDTWADSFDSSDSGDDWDSDWGSSFDDSDTWDNSFDSWDSGDTDWDSDW
jgi:hypothetical protein